jgi:hypothetical protein
VNQLTVEKVHNGSKEFAGWKAKHSNQIRFEAEYGGTIDGGNIYLRNCGDEVTSQLAKIMISLVFFINNSGLLEEVTHR